MNYTHDTRVLSFEDAAKELKLENTSEYAPAQLYCALLNKARADQSSLAGAKCVLLTFKSNEVGALPTIKEPKDCVPGLFADPDPDGLPLSFGKYTGQFQELRQVKALTFLVGDIRIGLVVGNVVVCPTEKGANWFLELLEFRRKHEIKQSKISKRVKTIGDKNFPVPWRKALVRAYKGEKGNDNKTLREILLAKNKGRFVELLSPPKQCKKAYRLMVNVKGSVVAKYAGVPLDDLADKGVISGATYKPKDVTSSWSVSMDMFTKSSNLNNIGVNQNVAGTYSVLLEVDLQANAERFLYNPDLLPHFLKTGQYGAEREVLSLGSLKGVTVTYQFYQEQAGMVSKQLFKHRRKALQPK